MSFNDILTGKSTNEQTTESKDPYRPDHAATDLECTSCRKLFPAAQAVAGRCRACAPPVDAALDAMRGPKADYTDYGANDRGRDFGLALLVVGVLAAAIIGGWYAKYRLRAQASEDVSVEYQYR